MSKEKEKMVRPIWNSVKRIPGDSTSAGVQLSLYFVINNDSLRKRIYLSDNVLNLIQLTLEDPVKIFLIELAKALTNAISISKA